MPLSSNIQDRSMISKLQEQLKECQKENAELNAHLEGAWGSQDVFVKRTKELKAELQEKNDAITKLRDKNDAITKLQEKVTRLEREAITRESNLQTKQQVITSLEETAALKEPLFQIGAKVRLRFLQITRSYYGLEKTIPWDKKVNSEGNQAAHNGNAALDKLLFKTGVLSGALRKRFSKVFETIYESSPDNPISMPQIMIDTLNYEVTIRTLRVLSDVRLIKERLTYFDRSKYALYTELPFTHFH